MKKNAHIVNVNKSVIGHYFHSCFSSIFDPTSLHIPYPSFSLMFVLVIILPLLPPNAPTTQGSGLPRHGVRVGVHPPYEDIGLSKGSSLLPQQDHPASSDLARDVLFPTGTGKVVTPSTRFTATSSYRIFVRMIYLPDKTLRWNAALAGTYSEGNKTQKHRSRNQNRRGILQRRKIVHHKIFLCLFQERLDTSF